MINENITVINARLNTEIFYRYCDLHLDINSEDVREHYRKETLLIRITGLVWAVFFIYLFYRVSQHYSYLQYTINRSGIAMSCYLVLYIISIIYFLFVKHLYQRVVRWLSPNHHKHQKEEMFYEIVECDYLPLIELQDKILQKSVTELHYSSKNKKIYWCEKDTYNYIHELQLTEECAKIFRKEKLDFSVIDKAINNIAERYGYEKVV